MHFTRRGDKNAPNLTPKPTVMETPNLACGLMFDQNFLEKCFLGDDAIIVTSRPYFQKKASVFDDITGNSNFAQRFAF